MKYTYRIVNALIAASAIPLAFLLKFVYFCIGTSESLSGIFETIGKAAGNENPYTSVGLEESFSIKDLIEIVTGNHDIYKFSDKGGVFVWPTELEIIDGRINATIALLIATLVIALFIVIWSICSDKRIPVLGASVAGLGTTIGMIACFNSLASVITSGEINLIKVFTGSSINGSDPGIVASLLSFLAKDAIVVDEFRFDGMQNGLLFVFIALIAWTAAFYLVELGDEEEKSAKKKH